MPCLPWLLAALLGTSFDAAQQNAAQRTRVQGLIADLNAPYGGPIRVSADTWTSVINSMR